MASEIRVNTINNRSGLGTITVADSGVTVSGVITAASGFSGALTGNVTGNVTGQISGIQTSLTVQSTGSIVVGNSVINSTALGIVTGKQIGRAHV